MKETLSRLAPTPTAWEGAGEHWIARMPLALRPKVSRQAEFALQILSQAMDFSNQGSVG